MASQANFKALSVGGGGKYLPCVPMRRGDEVSEAVTARPGRDQVVADHLRVKQVRVGDWRRCAAPGDR